MTDFEIGAVIAVIFLAVGIVVGVLIIVTLPQIRYYRHARRYLDDRMREELLSPDDEDWQSRWPYRREGS
jgi:hypothetical protein